MLARSITNSVLDPKNASKSASTFEILLAKVLAFDVVEGQIEMLANLLA
jgi:hypothetical protein